MDTQEKLFNDWWEKSGEAKYGWSLKDAIKHTWCIAFTAGKKYANHPEAPKYRTLTVGEIKQRDDEFWCSSGSCWDFTQEANTPVRVNDNIYRRKL